MTRTWNPIRSWSLTAMAVGGIAACGDRPAAGQAAAARPAARSDAMPEGCLAAKEVSGIVGTPLNPPARGFRGYSKDGITECLYLADEYEGVSLMLRIGPAAAADTVFANVQRNAKATLGQSAQADRVEVGEGGWAYGSNAKSEAAALSGGRVYHAEMDYFADDLGDKKGAMTGVVERMIQ